MRNLLHHISHLPRNAIALIIRGYQHTLSPDHGPLKDLFPHGYCIHSPTCSEYTRKAVLERGAVVGTLLGLWRVLHCNPWSKPDIQKIVSVTSQD